MNAAAEILFPEDPRPSRDEDQFVVIYGVEWKTYCAVRELFDSPRIRMTYFNGTLEIMAPSRRHEGYKKRIARLVELFALERDVPLSGYGSTTFKQELMERGLEPDECYVIGRDLSSDDDAPDIALEVVVTGGGINKLPVYQSLGVREVWFWHEGRFHLYALRAAGYEAIARSELIPELDFPQLAQFAEDIDQHAALKRYRDALRRR